MLTEHLRQQYSRAVHYGHDQFMIKERGEELRFITDYAKYLLEYLDSIGAKSFMFADLPKPPKKDA